MKNKITMILLAVLLVCCLAITITACKQDCSVTGEHTWDEGKVTKQADCEKDGEKTFTCSVCNETKKEVIKATGHTEVALGENVAADCENPGKTAGTKCSVCNKTLKAEGVVEALGHDYDESIAANVQITATCTVAGKKIVKCSRCDKTQETNVDALDHDFDETIEANVNVTQQATCTEAGSKTVKCSRCEVVDTKTIEAAGHKPVNVGEATQATCTEDGITPATKCSVCNTPLTEQSVAEKLGHNFDDKIEANVTVTKEATCTEKGSQTVKCSRCEVTDVQEIEMIPHSYVANVCSECSDEISQADVMTALIALEHEEHLPGTYKLTGVINRVDAYNTQYENITVYITIGDNTVQCYRMKKGESEVALDSLCVGDTITVVGELMRYNQTLEFTANCTLEDVVRGESNVTISIENGTISGVEAGKKQNGSTVTFTVTPDTDCTLESVMVNDRVLTANESGEYSFVVKADSAIVVSIAGSGKVAQKTVGLVFDVIGPANSWANGIKYQSVPTGDSNLTVTASDDGNEQANTGKYYNSGSPFDWRLYQANEGKMVITLASGYELVSIKLTFTNIKTVNINGIACASEQEFLFEEDKVTTAELTVVNGSARISSIIIVYQSECTHDYSGSVTKQATCMEKGVKTYVCSKCEKTYTEEVPVDSTNHVVNVETATWKNNDANHIKQCECGVVLAEAEHSFDSENNCVCGATAGHTHEYTVWKVAADGSHWKECADDGAKSAICNEEITYTYANDGVHNGTCVACGYSVTGETCDKNGTDGACSKCAHKVAYVLVTSQSDFDALFTDDKTTITILLMAGDKCMEVDGAGNNKAAPSATAVTISNGSVTKTDEVDKLAFTIEKVTKDGTVYYKIKSADGLYIGHSGTSNNVTSGNDGTDDKFLNSIVIDADGTTHIQQGLNNTSAYEFQINGSYYRYYKHNTNYGYYSIYVLQD